MDGFTFTKAGSHDTRAAILRTLALLTFCLYHDFHCLHLFGDFQSTINFEEGIGTASMAVLYVMFAVSSAGTAPVIIEKLTPKWALMTGWFSHTVFICVNAYPLWGTMVPASALLGFMSPVIWITQGVYFTALTRKYSLLTCQNLQIVMGRFSAVLEQIESLSQLAGSGIAAVVLHSVHYRNEARGEEVSDNIMSSLGDNQSSVVELWSYQLRPRMCG